MSEKNKIFFGVDWDNNSPAEDAIYSLGAIYNLVQREIDGVLRPFGVGITGFNALLITKYCGKEAGISQVELSHQLIVNPSNITRVLDILVKAGLIKRQAHKSDRRINLIKITTFGEALIDKIWPLHLQKIEELGAKINKTELIEFGKITKKWIKNI